MTDVRDIPIWQRVLLAALVSWLFAFSLGLVFATGMSGRVHLEMLWLPGVVNVALTISTLAALLITPLAAWTARTGTRNLLVYAPVIWLALALWILLVVPRTAQFGIYAMLPLACGALIALGMLPPARGRAV